MEPVGFRSTTLRLGVDPSLHYRRGMRGLELASGSRFLIVVPHDFLSLCEGFIKGKSSIGF
jgi:hypothetical protein